MGYLQQSNDIVVNSSRLLDDILSSNFNQFLQGLGQPVLVRYWTLNDTLSTADSGTDTTDEDIGPNSPNRYHRIENLPIYGALRDIVPELIQDDNLLDMEINVEGVVLPDTIRPSTYDYFEYVFGNNNERSLIFKINNVMLSTIKNNGYYKIEAHMVDVDNYNQYRTRINKQTTKELNVNLDTIGTNDKCIIESTHLKKVNQIDDLIDDLINQYMGLFYSEQYNALVYHGMLQNDYLAYDPWVTYFIIQNHIFTRKKKPIMLINYDEENGFRQKYNQTFFHAIEIRSLKYLKDLSFSPVSFSRLNTNPFAYYGEEVAFKLDIYPEEHTKYTPNMYMNIPIKENIQLNEKSPMMDEFEQLLVDYFNTDNLVGVVTDELLTVLENFVVGYTVYWFQFTPVLIYILQIMKKDVNNSYA